LFGKRVIIHLILLKNTENFFILFSKDTEYEFTALPNGFKIIYKNYKTSFFTFAETFYVDDSLLFGKSIDECRQNIMKTVDLSLKCGFLVHPVNQSLSHTRLLSIWVLF
jgi:hypothetical protein